MPKDWYESVSARNYKMIDPHMKITEQLIWKALHPNRQLALSSTDYLVVAKFLCARTGRSDPGQVRIIHVLNQWGILEQRNFLQANGFVFTDLKVALHSVAKAITARKFSGEYVPEISSAHSIIICRRPRPSLCSGKSFTRVHHEK